VNGNDDDGRPTALDSADPPRNFTLTADERIRALTIGAPAWSVRKRRIEDFEARMVKVLVDLHAALVKKGVASADVDAALHARAEALDLRRVNTLVEQHNRYYPVEANLRMEPLTGAYLVYGRRWTPEEPFSPERILAGARAAIASRDE
jgi:hypothetical protein